MCRATAPAQLLGAREPLILEAAAGTRSADGPRLSELVRADALISETLKLEETRFRKTLERGLLLLSDATSSLGKGDMLDGETAFKLYDTYGFPLDLTQDALRARGVGVDIWGFTDAMERQKAEARSQWAGSGEKATETVWFELKEKNGATEFLGYDTEKCRGRDSGDRQGRRRRPTRPPPATRCRSFCQPDAVLRRIRRTDG